MTATEALLTGAAYLVDENGRKLTGTPEQLLAIGTCWAHLRDGSDGQWYVHPLRQASELSAPQILEMLLPFPAHFPRTA